MSNPDGADVRRRAGWLAADQDALEEWIEGHRERVAARVTCLCTRCWSSSNG